MAARKTGSRAAKFKRCVAEVQKQRTADDPKAVCAKTIIHNPESTVKEIRNPKMAKKRRTAKQVAAFKKMRRGLAKWRREQGLNPRPRRRIVGRRISPRTVVRRAAPRRPMRKIRARPRSQVTRTRARAAARVPGRFFLKRGVRWFDGAGFTRDKGSAASYASMTAAKRIANKVANKTGGNVAIYG